MHQSEIPDGIVENNACRVVVDVSSFSTIEDGRSVYKKGRTLEWWVDSEEYSIIDMEKDVAKHFGWASNQEPIFWYVGPRSQIVRLATDQELLNLLRASKHVKFIMTIGRCVHVAESQVIDEGNELQVEVPYQVVVAEFEDQEWADIAVGYAFMVSKIFMLNNGLIKLMLCSKRKGEAAATSKPKKPSLPAKSSKRKGEAAATSKPKKSKKAAATTNTTSLAPQEPVSPGPTTRRMAASTSTPTSPGPITRRMASSTSTPTSPGPTTRRMAAQLDISPGGIARRLIIN